MSAIKAVIRRAVVLFRSPFAMTRSSRATLCDNTIPIHPQFECWCGNWRNIHTLKPEQQSIYALICGCGHHSLFVMQRGWIPSSHTDLVIANVDWLTYSEAFDALHAVGNVRKNPFSSDWFLVSGKATIISKSFFYSKYFCKRWYVPLSQSYSLKSALPPDFYLGHLRLCPFPRLDVYGFLLKFFKTF